MNVSLERVRKKMSNQCNQVVQTLTRPSTTEMRNLTQSIGVKLGFFFSGYMYFKLTMLVEHEVHFKAYPFFRTLVQASHQNKFHISHRNIFEVFNMNSSVCIISCAGSPVQLNSKSQKKCNLLKILHQKNDLKRSMLQPFKVSFPLISKQ